MVGKARDVCKLAGQLDAWAAGSGTRGVRDQQVIGRPGPFTFRSPAIGILLIVSSLLTPRSRFPPPLAGSGVPFSSNLNQTRAAIPESAR